MSKMIKVLTLVAVVCTLGATVGLAQMMNYNEAPMFKEMVSAGKLPSVGDRLPDDPMVVKTGILFHADELELEIGEYGGTDRTVRHNPNFDGHVFFSLNEPLLVSPGVYTDYFNPNVVKSYEVSSNGKVFTFHMREGLKWSDGMPVTTDDVLFAYEDVLLNKELTPGFPRWMKAAAKREGEPGELEVLDEFTFRISFAESYGGFEAQLSITGWRGYQDLIKPKHYLKGFHTGYTKIEDMSAEMEKEGLSKDEWAKFFHLKDIRNSEAFISHAVGFPHLGGWLLEEIGSTGTLRYVRNPYYFKVDTDGNQLPYLDRLRSTLVQDSETAVLKVLAGEVDHSWEEGTLARLPLLKENEKKGGYKVRLYKMHRTMADVFLNLTNPDPVWRQVARDVRFRRALGHAINSEEIIDSLYDGLAEPSIQRPNKYDPDLANRLLDEVGLTKRDSDGFRLGPDGKRFEVPIMFAPYNTDLTSTAELLTEYWGDVGIKTTVNSVEPQLRGRLINANDYKALLHWQTYPYIWFHSAGLHPGPYSNFIAPLWNQWALTGGEKGEKPSDEFLEFIDTVTRTMAVSAEDRQGVLDEWGKLIYDNLFWISTVDNGRYPIAINEKWGNVPSEATFGISTNYGTEVYYIKK